MPKQVKYKAWLPEKGIMWDYVSVIACKKGFIYNEDEPYIHNSQNWKVEWNYILLEYIGIKDREGKEIYEGDIVDGGCYNGSYQLGVITYVNNAFIALPTKRFSEGYSEDFSNFKVVGNIYQNKDLIQ